MRLDKFISSQLNISRKDARAAILRGRAAVDGTTVRAADFKINENADSVTFDGQALSYKKHIYIITAADAVHFRNGYTAASTQDGRFRWDRSSVLR